MDGLKFILFAFLTVYLSDFVIADSKIICYYDSSSNARQGQGKFDLQFIEPALQFCSHLVYGYAAIKEDTFKAVPLNEVLDVNKENYRHITDLKRRFPGLRVLLGVGGNGDVSGEGSDKNMKYRTLVESVENRLAFINSAKDLVKHYGFDGIDLGWEFPESKPKKIHNSFKGFFIGLKHKIVGESVIDEKAEEHKEQFTALVRELKNVFRHDGLIVSLAVLPNVNSSVYYDARQIAPHLDFVTLHAYDFKQPERDKKEADYPSPLYELLDRKVDENADFQVRYWLQHGLPANKLVLGIPTYGRSWKMTEDSGLTGVPSFPADGPGEAGPYTQKEGLLSYPEVCTKIATPNEIKAGYLGKLRKVNDPTKRYGTYAFRLPNDNGENGIWVGFEDPDTVGNKASYAKAKGLGGIALADITLDDFRGLCTGDKFPLLRAAKFRL